MTLRTRILAIGTVAALSIGGTVVSVAPAQAATPPVTDAGLVSCLTDEIATIPVLGPLLALLGGVVDTLLGSPKLTTLDCTGDSITSLAGLQGALNLTNLDLDNNGILDLSPLKNLPVTTLSALNQTVTLAPLALDSVTSQVTTLLPVIKDVQGNVIVPTIATGTGLATGIIDPVAGTITWTSNGVGELLFTTAQFAGSITRVVTSLTNPAYPVQTPVIGGSALVGSTLSVNGDSSTTFQWKRGGSAIAGATASTYVPVFADLGSTLTVTATGSGTGYHTASLTSAETPAVDVAAPVPTVSGAASVGSTLTLSAGAWSPGLTLTYQWKRSTARSPHSIPGATGSTYIPTTADVGLTITAWVTGTNADNVFVKSSAATAAVVAGPAAAPVPVSPAAHASVLTTTPVSSPAAVGTALRQFTRTAAPKITGTAKAGKKLGAKVGTWTKGATFSYRWKANGKTIAKATHKTFVVTKKYVGKKITVAVTGRLSGYASVTKTSASTKRVAR